MIRLSTPSVFSIHPVPPLPKRCFCPTCPSPAGGALISNQAFPLTIKGKDVTTLQCCFFDPPRPSFAKEGSTFSPSPSSSGSGDVTALRCSEPLRSKVGGASKPSPCFAGWDRLGTACFFPSPCSAGWDRVGNLKGKRVKK